jgi:hypothetical protein
MIARRELPQEDFPLAIDEQKGERGDEATNE